MGRVCFLCGTVLFLASGGFSTDLSKHLDPPGPPKLEEFVYLYEFTMLVDWDDGLPIFDGDTEILITTTIEKVGHETQTWTRLVNDIDMDGDLATEYRVLNGDAGDPRAEQKGGKAKIFAHFECSPAANMNLDIEVYEVNSFGIGDVLQLLGKAAGGLTEAGLLNGYKWVGNAAEKVGKALDGIGEEETELGTDSGLIPAGISPVRMPTVNYRYRTEYLAIPIDAEKCENNDSRAEAWERQNDTALEDVDLEWYESLGKGFDDQHPFTMSPDEALLRGAWLQDALDKIDDVEQRQDEDAVDTSAIQEELRSLTSDLACTAIETEINEAFAAPDDPPNLVWDAFFAWEDGTTLALAGDHAGAVDSCMFYLDEMLVLNHPEVFYNGFEGAGTGSWPTVVGESIVVFD